MPGIATVHSVSSDTIVLHPPKSDNAGADYRILPLRLNDAQSYQLYALRFQVGDPRQDSWLRLHHSGQIRAFDLGSPQSLSVDAIITCPKVAAGLRRLEHGIMELFATNAPQWWPDLSTTVPDMLQYTKQIWVPMVDEKKVQGKDATIINLIIQPWDQWGHQATQIIRVDKYNKAISKGDVTDLIAGAEVFPIIRLSAVICRTRSVRVQVTVTDILVKNQLKS